jgi:hypothetical protein
MAWRQPGKLRLPRTRKPASTPPSPPGYGQSSPVAEGLALSSEPMTTPSTRGRREAGCRQGPQPLHRHGLDPPRARATAAWLERDRLVAGRRSPVAGRRRWPGSTRRRGNVLLDQLAQQAPRPRRRPPRQRAGRGSGANRGWPRAQLDPPARPAIAVRLAGRADERDHAHRPDGPAALRRWVWQAWRGWGTAMGLTQSDSPPDPPAARNEASRGQGSAGAHQDQLWPQRHGDSAGVFRVAERAASVGLPGAHRPASALIGGLVACRWRH